MYRCAQCNKQIDDIRILDQCSECGSKIFFKERPPIMKVLYTD